MALFDIFNRKKAEADQQLQPDVVVTEDATTSNVETAIPAAETASEADVPTSASEPEQPQQPFAAEDVADDDTTKKKGFFRSLFSREKKETLDKGLEKTKQGVFAKLLVENGIKVMDLEDL